MDLASTTGFLAAAVGGLALAYLAQAYMRWNKVRSKLATLPQPPGSLPILGHALQLAKDRPWLTMEEWIKKFNYGTIVVEFMMQSGIVVANPDMLRRVLDKNQKNYKKDTQLAYKSFMDLLGHGILTSHGEKWRQKRYLLSNAFRTDILEETAPVAKNAADRLSKILEEHMHSGKPVDLAEEFRVLTLQVIGELLLSLTPEESRRVFPELYLPIVDEANLRVWYPWRGYLPTWTNFNYHRTLRKLNAYLADLISKRWAARQQLGLGEGQQTENSDLLDRILASIKPETWDNSVLIDLRDEMKSFMLAGHETSASMLTWSMYELMLPENQHAQQKLLAEGKSVFANCRVAAKDGKDEYQGSTMPPVPELNNLAYTMNTLRESLRKYSLVPLISRDAIEDDTVEGVFVPAGTKIFIHIRAVHWNPAYWPEPAKFQPERFEKEYDPYTFLPFIVGPRNCLGQHLALLESRIILSLLQQRFVFTPARDDLHVTHPYLVPVCPEHGMIVNVKRRE